MWPPRKTSLRSKTCRRRRESRYPTPPTVARRCQEQRPRRTRAPRSAARSPGWPRPSWPNRRYTMPRRSRPGPGPASASYTGPSNRKPTSFGPPVQKRAARQPGENPESPPQGLTFWREAGQRSREFGDRRSSREWSRVANGADRLSGSLDYIQRCRNLTRVLRLKSLRTTASAACSPEGARGS
jgi:hypothetical protein